MKLYTPLIMLLVLCLLITGCTFIVPTESRDDSGTGKKEWTHDIPLTGAWTAEQKLSEIGLVTLCEDAVPMKIKLTNEKTKGTSDDLEARTAYAEVDPNSTVTGTFMGLANEIETYNNRAKGRTEKELKETEIRQKAYQGLFSKDTIYLISRISMRIGRSDTRVLSYIEEVYQWNREEAPDFYEVHGHTIDPVTGQALSLNDFFTSVEALPGLIFALIPAALVGLLVAAVR